MGNVLKFDRTARASRSVDGSASRGERARGEVIIFPGVRMERQMLDLATRIGRKRENGPRGGVDLDPRWTT